MSKSDKRAKPVDKANYKPLSGLGPAMSPQEIAVEKGNADARNKGGNKKYGPVEKAGEDAQIMYKVLNSPSTDPILSASFERSDAEMPKSVPATPTKSNQNNQRTR